MRRRYCSAFAGDASTATRGEREEKEARAIAESTTKLPKISARVGISPRSTVADAVAATISREQITLPKEAVMLRNP